MAIEQLPTVWDPAQRIGEIIKGERGLTVGIGLADGSARAMRQPRRPRPFHWLCVAQRPARPRQRLRTRGLRADDAGFPLLLHRDGAARRAADERRQHDDDDQLLRLAQGGRQYTMMGPVQAAPDAAVTRSFGGRLIDIAEVGRMVGFLALGATLGETRDSIYVDAGLHNMA